MTAGVSAEKELPSRPLHSLGSPAVDCFSRGPPPAPPDTHLPQTSAHVLHSQTPDSHPPRSPPWLPHTHLSRFLLSPFAIPGRTAILGIQSPWSTTSALLVKTLPGCHTHPPSQTLALPQSNLQREGNDTSHLGPLSCPGILLCPRVCQILQRNRPHVCAVTDMMPVRRYYGLNCVPQKYVLKF